MTTMPPRPTTWTFLAAALLAGGLLAAGVLGAGPLAALLGDGGSLPGFAPAGSLAGEPAWTRQLPGAFPFDFAVAGGGRTVAVARVADFWDLEGRVAVLDAGTGAVRFDLRYPFSFCCNLPPVDLDAAGDRLFVGGDELLLVDAESGRVEASYDPPRDDEDLGYPEVPVTAALAPDGSAAFAPTWTANHLVALDGRGEVLWERPFGDGWEFADVAVSADGRRVAVAAVGSVALHDARSGRVLLEHRYGDRPGFLMPSVAVDRAGTRLAALGAPEGELTLSLFDASSSAPRWTRPLGRDDLGARVFMTHDGARIVVSSARESAVLDADGRVVLALPAGTEVLDFAEDGGAALLLVRRPAGEAEEGAGGGGDGGEADRADRIEVLRVGPGVRETFGSFAAPEGLRGAALVGRDVLVASTLRDGDGGRTGAILLGLHPPGPLPEG